MKRCRICFVKVCGVQQAFSAFGAEGRFLPLRFVFVCCRCEYVWCAGWMRVQVFRFGFSFLQGLFDREKICEEEGVEKTQVASVFWVLGGREVVSASWVRGGFDLCLSLTESSLQCDALAAILIIGRKAS